MNLANFSKLGSKAALCFGVGMLLSFSPLYAEQSSKESHQPIDETFITADKQAELTPDVVIERLKDGNRKFVNGHHTHVNTNKRISTAANLGQFPKAVVLSCIDSRVPVEDVFQKGVGDIFVARVAGNILNEDILGSLEYACKVSNSKVIVVLGHGDCGAVNSAIKNVKLGNITSLLEKISPAVEDVKKTFKGEASVKNKEFTQAVCNQNVINTIDRIRKESPILQELETNGEIQIVGANYNIQTGQVEFLN